MSTLFWSVSPLFGKNEYSSKENEDIFFKENERGRGEVKKEHRNVQML